MSQDHKSLPAQGIDPAELWEAWLAETDEQYRTPQSALAFAFDRLSRPIPPQETTDRNWRCGARQRHIGAEIQDCDWPACGCDPYASKVLDAIAESGFKIVPAAEANASSRDVKSTEPKLDAETIQTLLNLLNPLHGSLDKQTYDEKVSLCFDANADHEYAVVVTAQNERDLTQAVCILENRRRDPQIPSPAGSGYWPAELAQKKEIERLRAQVETLQFRLNFMEERHGKIAWDAFPSTEGGRHG